MTEKLPPPPEGLYSETTTLRFPSKPNASAALNPQVSTPQAPEVPAAPSWPSSSLQTITPPMRDSAYYSLQLPSDFFWYDFKELSTSIIKGSQQGKLTRAAKEGSAAYVVEAIASTLGNPERINDLALGDFYYILYWLRFASYTSFAFHHASRCTAPEHLTRVAEGKAHPESLLTIHSISTTHITEKVLDAARMQRFLDAADEVLAPFGLRSDVPRVKDLVPCEQYRQEFGTPDANGVLSLDEELTYCTDRAPCVRRLDEGPPLSFAERIKLVQNLPADVLFPLDALLEESSNYGIEEFIKVNCKECGAEHRTKVSISALTFLR